MRFHLEGKVIFFATNNIHKFNEAREVLNEYKIATGMLRAKSLEIQDDSLDEIAKASVTAAFKKCNLPIIVEDAGLFVEVLKGFPGPYAAYVYRTIGNKGLLQIMKDIENRKAKFQSTVAFARCEYLFFSVIVISANVLSLFCGLKIGSKPNPDSSFTLLSFFVISPMTSPLKQIGESSCAAQYATVDWNLAFRFSMSFMICNRPLLPIVL